MKKKNENSAEIWDLYDKNRIPTGKTHKRGEPMKKEDYHLVVHVCIFNSKNELLIQQRQPFKEGWPNMWDLTVGGSATSGDTSQSAAEREVFEEIGLKLDLSDVRPVFTINFPDGFDDYYVIEQDVDLSKLKLQETEVQKVKWASKEEVLKMEEEGLMISYWFLEKLFDKTYNINRHTLKIKEAEMKNVPSWMSFIEIVRDSFPGLETEKDMEEYRKTVIKFIEQKRAICAVDGKMVVGILLYSKTRNMLCCMAVLPEYRRQKIGTKMIQRMLQNLDTKKDIVVETFREGDEKGKEARAFYKSLGFEEGELCYSENQYPVQKFILKSIAIDTKSKFIIFDMDGLMFDTERVFIDAWDYAGEKIGIGKAGYMVYKTLGMNIAAAGNIWKEEFGDSYNGEELRKYTKEFLQKYYTENKVPVKPGLYVLLDYLKQAEYKMAVATSSPRWEVEKHLKDAGVYHYFIGIICGDMIQNSKPNPESYLKACEILGCKPSESFALEDSKNGLLSAYRAGCKAIMVPDLWQPDEETEKILYGKFEDLEKVKEFLEKNE